MDSFFLRFLYKSLYGTNYIFNERRIIMGNELIKRINDVKCEIKKLENELRELERVNVHFYALVMYPHDDMLGNYFQISDEAISEAETKGIIQDEYWHYADIYRIGYVLISKETNRKIGDLVALRLIKRNINRCRKQINSFCDLDGLDIFEQQLDKTVEKLNWEINAVVDISDVTFVDFDD